ncbi:hypothetical protein SANTM175S_01637 [Streptomyces antimycoticus]
MRIAILVSVIGFFGWPYVGRIVRGQTLSLREKEYIEAARSLGAGRRYILFPELLPNLVAPITVYATLMIPTNILTEAALSFLGAGVKPPTASWGQMLSKAVGTYEDDPMFMIIPGSGDLHHRAGLQPLRRRRPRRARSEGHPMTARRTTRPADRSYPNASAPVVSGSRLPEEFRGAMPRTATPEVATTMKQLSRSRRIAGAAAVVGALLATAGCGGGGSDDEGSGAGFNAAVKGVAAKSAKKGGTLKFINKQEFDSLTPQRQYYGFAWDFSRFYARQLISYAPKPGNAAQRAGPGPRHLHRQDHQRR